MKRFLLVFSVLIFLWQLPSTAFATHVSGGEITYENVGGDTFIVTLTLYRDCSGLGLGTGNQTVRVTSSCTTPFNLSLALQNPGGTEVSQICPSQIGSSQCNGGSLPGMQAYYYQGQIVLGTNCANYLFQYQINNRNSSINVLNSSTSPFYVESTLNSILYPNNSSPVYTASPIPYVCLNQTVNYNYGVVENNGDSLVYSLVGARTATPGWVVSNMTYNTGYSATAPISGITIDPSTGQLSFTPSTPLGNYIVVTRVTEYNGAGQVVATVQRDIQFVVMNCSNQIPVNPTTVTNLVNTVGSASLTSPLEITANVGDQFCFELSFSDTNVNDSVYVETNATSALPGSIVTITGTNPTVAEICWTVPPGMNTNNTVTFQASDSACPVSGVNSIAVQVIVPQPPSLAGTLTTTDISCNGVCDGTANVVPTGGVGPYSVYWFPNPLNTWCCQGQTSISNMCAGTYILIVTDLGDPDPSTNTWDTIFSIIDAAPIAIIPPVIVHDNCDTSSCGGSLTAFAFGGSPPRSYSWSNGGSANTITGLCNGIYTLTVTDANNCTQVESYTIYEPTPFNLQVDSIDSVTCFGDNDGAIYVSAFPACGVSTASCLTPTSVQVGSGIGFNTGSTYPAPYGNSNLGAKHQILFTAAELNAAGIQPGSISSLAFDIGVLGTALNYENFTVKMGCTSSSDLTGGWETGLYEVILPTTHSVTLGWNTHDFDVDYYWDGITNVVVEVCFNNISLVPNGNSGTNYTTTTNQSVRYFYANNDSVCADLGVVGTSANRPNVRFGNCPSSYTYAWSPSPAAGQITPSAVGLTAQTYVVTVTSNDGCADTISATVEGPSEIMPVVTLTSPISCPGLCDAAFVVNSTGGKGSYTYVWSGGLPADSVQSGLCVGTYYFTVTDAIGCIKEDSIEIVDPPIVLGNINIANPVSCNGVCDGAVTFAPSGGNGGPYTVTWPAGVIVSNDTASGLCGLTLYMVTIVDGTGCVHFDSVSLSEPSPLLSSITLNQQISCGGVCDAQITAVVSGGTPVYSFLWSNGATTPTISNLCAGNYSVTITDSHFCTSTSSITIGQPLPMVTAIVQSGLIQCNGDTNVSLFAQVVGGVSPYTYAWSNGGNSATISNLGAGTYTVTVTDSLGCENIVSQIILQPTPLVVGATITSLVQCGGSCTGGVTINASGGSPGYTYAWPGGLTGPVQTTLCAGNYTVTVTDTNMCVETVSFSLADPTPMNITHTIISNATCNGDCDGEASVNATGGVGTIVYTWPGGLVGPIQDSLCAGTYVVTATDSNLCTVTENVIISEPNALLLSLTQVGIVLCAGDNGVNIISAVSGGTPPYQFLWTNGGPTTPNLINVGADTYALVVVDTNLCTASAGIVVTEPDTLDVSITVNSIIACGGNPTGELTAVVTGGTMPYSYSWSNGDTVANINNLPGGTYTITITDNNGCSDTASVTLINPSTTIANRTILNQISCNSVCDGSVTYAPSGGTPPYVISWPAGLTVTNDTATMICGGTTYIVTISDSNLCQTYDTFNLVSPTAIVAGIILDDPISCFGACDANVTAVVSGGVAPFVFQWSNGLSGASLNGLCADTYSITITDTNMCLDSATIIITEPNLLVTSLSQTGTIACFGDTSVDLTATTIGGTLPYSYLWSNFDTVPVLTNVGAGTYFVTTTDANGCSDIDTIVVSSPTQMVIDSSNIVNPTCGASDGSIEIFVSGGTPGYTYLWNGTTPGNPLVNVPAGIYNVLITDTIGCTRSIPLSLSDIGAPGVSIATTNVNCAGDCIGTATATVTGTGPFGYIWSNGDSTFFADSLCIGSIQLSVTDSSNGCVSASVGYIGQDTLLTVVMDSVDNTLCGGTCNGQASVSVTSWFGQLSYNWSNGDTTDTIVDLCAGVYIVTVTDTTGCYAIDSVVISDVGSVSIAMDSVDNTFCNALCNGQASVSVLTSTGTLSYLWNTTDTTDTIVDLCAGVYTVTVTDSTGCFAIDSITVLDGTPLSITIDTVINTTCTDASNGAIQIIVNAGNPSFTYNWAGPNGFTDTLQNISNIPIGQYFVTVTDSLGCMVIDSADVISDNSLFISLKDTTLCDGPSTLVLTPIVTGVNGTESYVWNNVAGDTIGNAQQLTIPFPTTTTKFFVTVLLDGCMASDSAVVTVLASPDADAGPNQTIIVDESVIIGGNPTTSWGGATFVWDPIDFLNNETISNPTASPLVTTLYTVYVTNILGCTSSDTVRVTVLKAIEIFSGFTPNGDGDNDVWNLPMLAKYPNVNVDIYNRWGELLFHSEGYDEPWDGNYNGEPLPVGTYYYVIDLKDGQFPDPLSGPVTIMR